MLKETSTPIINRLARIKGDENRNYLLWSYFDLAKTVLLATGLGEKDGGDGNQYVMTVPKDTYNKFSLVIGNVRVLGIGYATKIKIVGLTFIYGDIGMKPEFPGWIPWRWSKFKQSEAIGKKPYLTTGPDDLLTYGDKRLRWLTSVLDIAAPMSKNKVEYRVHNAMLYPMCFNLYLRQIIFQDAGIEVKSDWVRGSTPIG